MNHLLLAFWFLQELRKKKKDMESEEEKKMEGQQNCYHDYNKYTNGHHG